MIQLRFLLTNRCLNWVLAYILTKCTWGSYFRAFPFSRYEIVDSSCLDLSNQWPVKTLLCEITWILYCVFLIFGKKIHHFPSIDWKSYFKVNSEILHFKNVILFRTKIYFYPFETLHQSPFTCLKGPLLNSYIFVDIDQLIFS